MEPVRLRLGDLPEEEIARRTAEVLRKGGIALLPAEGVYGFHVSPSSSSAVDRIRALKGRSDRAGFIGLIAEPQDATRWARLSSVAEDLARKHWPGALTLVLDALENAPTILRSTEATIALRCPGSALLREVVALLDAGPMLSTSANHTGKPPAIRFEDAPVDVADLGVDGGVLSGSPSTVVRITRSEIRVLRAGAVDVGVSGELGPS